MITLFPNLYHKSSYLRLTRYALGLRKLPNRLYRAGEELRRVLFPFKSVQMRNPKDAPKLAALTQFIDSYFGGQLEEMARQLYETIYMLHYVDPDLFSQDSRIEKVVLLYSMADCLQKEPEENEEKPLPD